MKFLKLRGGLVIMRIDAIQAVYFYPDGTGAAIELYGGSSYEVKAEDIQAIRDAIESA